MGMLIGVEMDGCGDWVGMVCGWCGMECGDGVWMGVDGVGMPTISQSDLTHV